MLSVIQLSLQCAFALCAAFTLVGKKPRLFSLEDNPCKNAYFEERPSPPPLEEATTWLNASGATEAAPYLPLLARGRHLPPAPG